MRGPGRLAAVMCSLAGCVGAPPAPPQETEGSGGTTAVTTTSVSATTSPSGGSGPNPSTTSSGPGTTDTTADDTRGDDPTDPFPEDWGLEGACSTWAQDCPEGEKCMPWSFDGSETWNATRCSPVGNEAAQVGDSCVVEGSPYSGVDSCALGLMCWGVSPETNVGTCEPLCQGQPQNPICEDPDTVCAQFDPDVLNLCLAQCDPLLQDCPESGGCYPTAEGQFVCIEPAGNTGLGDPCDAGGECSPGLLCISAEALSGCDGQTGCCAPICDTSNAEPCNDGQVCQPIYAEGMEPPGLETVGACVSG